MQVTPCCTQLRHAPVKPLLRIALVRRIHKALLLLLELVVVIVVSMFVVVGRVLQATGVVSAPEKSRAVCSSVFTIVKVKVKVKVVVVVRGRRGA